MPFSFSYQYDKQEIRVFLNKLLPIRLQNKNTTYPKDLVLCIAIPQLKLQNKDTTYNTRRSVPYYELLIQ